MTDREYGRENRKDNNLFFTCSLIDYIARKTKSFLPPQRHPSTITH